MKTTPFDTPLLTGDELLILIPQRPPVVMVDSFYGTSGGLSYTGLTIDKGNMFCLDGVFGECGVIEHIAQSAAVWAGYNCLMQHKPAPLGVIGSVDKMTFHAPPVAGETLHTTIRMKQEVFDITLFSATVCAGDRPVAEGLLKIQVRESP
jgi:predicted hotdog family 3-hydroxylacyl-ACP dehydratase